MKAARPLFLALLSVLAVAGVGVWGWSVNPERPLRWVFVVFSLPLFWGMIEFLQGGSGRRGHIMNWHRLVVAALGFMMAVKIGSKLAIATELLDARWGPVVARGLGVLMGFLLAVWGNYLPKLISPWRREEEWFDWQRVHRFVGWLATLSGIALMAVWLTLQPESARLATLAITIVFCVLSVGRKWLSVANYTQRPSPPREMT